jgi:hypothetical protein
MRVLSDEQRQPHVTFYDPNEKGHGIGLRGADSRPVHLCNDKPGRFFRGSINGLRFALAIFVFTKPKRTLVSLTVLPDSANPRPSQ